MTSVKLEDMLKIKQSMMIEAIFHHFFTEFNDSLLTADLNVLLFRDEMNLTDAQIEAETRFANPQGAYYKRKVTTKKETNPANWNRLF